MHIVHPQFLLMLIPAAAGLFLLARRKNAYRPWPHFALRMLIAGAAAIAAAGVQARRPDYSAERFFLLDVSDSAGLDAPAALEEIGRIARSMDRRDRLAVIAFGRRPSLEFGPESPKLFEPAGIRSTVDPTATDIAAALALARSQHQDGSPGQIVMITDGNQTTGNAPREALRLAAAGLPVYCLPIERSSRDFRVRFADHPQAARPGEAFRVTLEVSGTGRTGITVRTDEGRSVEGALVANGSALWRAELALDSAGLHFIHATITPADDSILLNNKCTAAVWVPGPASLLWISAAESRLAAAVDAAGYSVKIIEPSAAPVAASELLPYDAVIIEDCPAWKLKGSMAALQTYVQHTGGGLIMAGGSKAFGPGGYVGTAVEAALPVKCDPEEQKAKPMALVAVIDRSGSMGEVVGGRKKINFAKEGVLRLVEHLKPEDRVAVIAFHGTPDVLLPLAAVHNAQQISEMIKALDPYGKTDLNPALAAALDQLAAVDDKYLKHVVLLSDGLSVPVDVDEWARKFSEKDITVSVVATGDEANRELLEGLALQTGGTFYSVENISDVTEIFVQETMRGYGELYRRSDEGFPVRLLQSTLANSLSAPPPAHGYVLVKPKDDAQTAIEVADGQALLTTWRFGIGRSAAFMAPPGEPAGWDGTVTLWANIINWTARKPGEAAFSTTVTVDKGTARIEVADTGEELKDYRAEIVTPSGTTSAIRLQQTAIGLYTAEFAVDVPGEYPVSIVENSDGGALQARTAAVLSYSAEWAETRADRRLLSEIAQATNGRMLKGLAELPSPTGGGAGAFADITWLPALAALILFLIELAIP
jgi:Mg-chelatase subunit ChlD